MLTDNQIDILKVIERNHGIHHNKLLRIIVDQKHLMAKTTLEKNINELIDTHHIKVHRYKKEKQYFRNEEDLSEKDLDKEITELFCKVFNELKELEKNFKSNEYSVKTSFAHYLFMWLRDFSKVKRTIETETIEINETDMSEEVEIVREIKQIIKKKGIDFQNPLHKYFTDSLEVMTELSKMKNEYVKLQKTIRKHGASKKRISLKSQLTQLTHKMSEKFTRLETNLEELKKKTK